MEIEKFDNETLEVLKTAKGTETEYKFNEIVPTKWNNLKREYVAEIVGVTKKFDGLERQFISNVDNYREGGKTADLLCVEPEEDNCLLEIRAGSHRNLLKTIFRKEGEKYKIVAIRNGASAYYGGGNTTKWNIFK